MPSINLKSLATVAIAISLSGCIKEKTSSDSEGELEVTSSTEVNTYTSIENCISSQISNCNFQKGIYVLKLHDNVEDEHVERVVTQVRDLLTRASDDVRKLFAQKRIILGVMESEPEDDSEFNRLAIALAENANDGATVIDGIELVYTNIDGVDETTKATSYQKLIQLFDYYIDQNNTPAATDLILAYQEFLEAIAKGGNEAGDNEYLAYDKCNYGNGQLEAGTCAIDEEEDPDGTGTRDMIHTIEADLNPGALFGTVYEYMLNPDINTPAGELSGSKGNSFQDEGAIGTSADHQQLNWSNPAFKPLAEYLEKWFFKDSR